MAEKKDAAKEAPAADAPGKGGKGKLIAIVAVVGVLLLGGGGAGAWLLLGKKDANQTGAEAKVAPKKMPVFVELDMFTVNLKDKEDERFMQVKLVAEVKDAPAGEMLKTLMPSVRNEILLLLGSKQAGEVATREGKEKLAQEIVASANKVLEGTPAAKSVEGVNFTHLIVQ
ncbi:MAG: flagellar basal body-associated FliL family protein [Burkholderiaceae bacterium]|jgi:flagellar FliL protein|nr:flagellar basal body-associated FliL family protein [Burkholderiaceae bacterium]